MSPDPYAWNLHPYELVAVAVLAALYGVGVGGLRVAHWRLACFAGGLALVLAVAVTPIASLANHYLLSAHLLQNVALAEWAPALLVLGIPPALAERLSAARAVRIATHPAAALPLWLATYAAWHVPAAYDAALRHPSTLLHLEHACYVTAGALFWWPVLQRAPHLLSAGQKAAYLFAAFMLASPLGIVISLVSTPIYGFYVKAPDLWDLSDLGDQQIAGVSMSVEQAVVFFCLCAYFVVRFVKEEESRAAFEQAAPRPISGSR